MKKTLLAAFLALAGLSLQAQEYWSDVKYVVQGVSNLAAYAVVPQGVAITGIRAVVNPPAATSILRIWQATNSFMATNLTARTANTTSNLPLATPPTYFTAGEKVIVHDISAGVYQRGIVQNTNATSIILTNDKTQFACEFPYVYGDAVYKLRPVYEQLLYEPASASVTINWQAAQGGCIWKALSAPAMVELISTNGNKTNLTLCVSGIWEK